MVSGCAVNPATKERQFMIVSEDQEFAMGQEVDKQVREEMGVYTELPELRSLVKNVGETMGQNSDRPNLIYRIEIVDSPDFNAFAVPGGFVYANRGLLERMNSADELASVLGHEVAHVAARHSAAQISKAQLMNIGLIGVAIATDGAISDYGELIQLGGALAFNKFSRDAEREADHFGIEYMVRAGYNPMASIDVMRQIERLKTRVPSQFEAWFMTHPPVAERLDNLQGEIDRLRSEQPGALDRPIRRNEYVRLLDGLAVGEWNGNEIVSGDRYYNKEHLLSFAIPEGWRVQINSDRFTVLFAHPKKEFDGFFNIEPLQFKKSTQDYFQDFEQKIKRFGLKKEKEMPSTHRDFPHGALAGFYSGYDQTRGPILAEGIAFVEGTMGYYLIGSSKEDDFAALQPILESMIESLRFISHKEALDLEPPRLTIHEVETGENWTSVTEQYFPSSQGEEKLAEYNGFDTSQELTPGVLLKIPPSLRF
jgi:predicted Zn-dependent protease